MKAVSPGKNSWYDAAVARPRTPVPIARRPGRHRPPSIEDVAGAAQVSIATVSRYINEPSLVSPATGARVMRAIEELGYRPNRFAQGLITRRSHTIGIVLPDIHGEFYSELLRGASAEARRSRYHLLVTSGAAETEGAQTIDSGTFGLVDGLALMITEPNEPLWRAARATGLPIVTLDTDPGEPGVDSILIDNKAGTTEAVTHLLASVPSHRCYFVGGPKDNFDTRQRAAAFAATLSRAGHKPRPDQAAFGDYSPEWGRRWVAEHAARARSFRMSDNGQPESIAVMAGNDEIAFGVMDALQAMGRSVPRDARIVGFDDSRLASLVRPTLSTVRVPLSEVGATVVAALIHRIRDPSARVVSKTLATRLVIRDSSRAPDAA
jgi:LacI family transcriptional regulator